ncbi:MAG: hypothetical protein ACE5IJ_05120 [Thermoplasmata archaeon]
MRPSAMQMPMIFMVLTFLVASSFVLLYDYPLGSGQAFFRRSPPGEDVWTGGTIPDEDAYYGWAQIYYETGKQYVYLEDLGRDKIASVDFFLGPNESTSVFTSFSTARTDEPGVPEWLSKSADIGISVLDGNDEGLSSALVHLVRFGESGQIQEWDLVTDENGTLLFENAPPGFYLYEVRTPLNPAMPLIQRFATDYPNFDYPIVVTARILSMSGGSAVVSVHVDHYANLDLPDIPVFEGPPGGAPICLTDEAGDCLVDLQAGGRLFHLTAVKENKGIYPPVASGIVEVNGRYAIANHWPPGYCYLIIPFWLAGMIELITIFLFAIAMVSTFVLARRCASLRVALVSSMLTAVAGLAIIMLYSRGMTDYASMTFAVAGIALFVESLQNWKERFPRFGGLLSVLLGLLGGLSLAYSVTTRYSTIVVLLGPLIYLYLILEKGDTGWRRFFPRAKPFARALVRTAPFLIGLLIVGILLAGYNATLFGGPFNSGYQTSARGVFDPGSGNLTVTGSDESMFESYFHPSWEMFENMWYTILPTLFFLIPIIYMTPVSLWQERKRKETWLLFFWLLPVCVIYMQLTWVGHIYEDMRYFLPVLPPAAILVSLSLERNFLSNPRFQMYGLIAMILIALSGLLVADYCINWQLTRLAGGMRGMTFEPPALVGFLAASAIVTFYGGVVYRSYLSGPSRTDKG